MHSPRSKLNRMAGSSPACLSDKMRSSRCCRWYAQSKQGSVGCCCCQAASSAAMAVAEAEPSRWRAMATTDAARLAAGSPVLSASEVAAGVLAALPGTTRAPSWRVELVSAARSHVLEVAAGVPGSARAHCSSSCTSCAAQALAAGLLRNTSEGLPAVWPAAIAAAAAAAVGIAALLLLLTWLLPFFLLPELLCVVPPLTTLTGTGKTSGRTCMRSGASCCSCSCISANTPSSALPPACSFVAFSWSAPC